MSASNDAKRLAGPPLEIAQETEATVRHTRQGRPPSSGASKPRKRPADRSKAVVAVLNDRFRIVDDGLQWMLQKRKGRPTPKSTGWRNAGCCVRSRALLLDGISKLQVDPDALRILEALPHVHPSMTRAPLVSERGEDCEDKK